MEDNGEWRLIKYILRYFFMSFFINKTSFISYFRLSYLLFLQKLFGCFIEGIIIAHLFTYFYLSKTSHI